MQAMGRLLRAGVLVTVVGGAAFAAVAGPAAGSQVQAGAAALIAACLSLWATGLLSEFTTALLFFLVAVLTKLAPPQAVFSGFSTASVWLVIAGLIIGVAVEETGLAARLGGMLARASRGSHTRAVAAVLILDFVAAVLMPSSMGRIVLLAPVVLAACDQLGYGVGSKGRVSLVLAFAFGTFILSAAIMPSNVPNLVSLGVFEKLFAYRPTYLAWLAMHAPSMLVVKGLILFAALVLLFPSNTPPARLPAAPQALTGAEKRLLAILLVTLSLWVTDFLHGISPAWVGLAAAVVLLLPGVGLLTEKSIAKVNFKTVLYVAAILGVAGLTESTGLTGLLGRLAETGLPLSPDAPFLSFAKLYGLAAALSTVLTGNNVAPVYSPLAAGFAKASGFPLQSVLALQVEGYSNIFAPYQIAPIVVGLGLGGVSMRQGAVLGLSVGLASLLAAAPICYLWWRLIGWI